MTKRLLIGTAEGRHSPITYQLEVLWFVHTGNAKGSFGERDCFEVVGRSSLYGHPRAWLQGHGLDSTKTTDTDYLLWFCSLPHSVSTWGKRKQIWRVGIYCKIFCPSRELQHFHFSFPVLTLESYLVFHSRWDIFTNESSVHELKKIPHKYLRLTYPAVCLWWCEGLRGAKGQTGWWCSFTPSNLYGVPVPYGVGSIFRLIHNPCPQRVGNLVWG